MKILLISPANSTHTVKWVNALAACGNEVHVAFCKNHPPKQNAITNNAVLHCLPFSAPYGYYLNASSLKKLIKKIKPDIVNCHYASGYGTLSRRAKAKNLILSVWGSDVYDFPYQSKFNRKTLKKNLNYAAHLASTSHCMASQTRKFLFDENRDITVTPFGVDINNFKKLNIIKNNDKIIIGTVKALNPKYGITDSIKAFSKVYKDLKAEASPIAEKLYYEIYGRGEQELEIIKLIEQLNMQDRVFLKGYVDNDSLPKIINTFEIFVATSIYDSESFGVAAVEAMACGVPVVVSDVDGFKEVVSEGESGLIVPRENIDKIAEAIKKLIFDSELRIKMGNNGVSRVAELYDWNKNVKIMTDLYAQSFNAKD